MTIRGVRLRTVLLPLGFALLRADGDRVEVPGECWPRG